MTQLLGFHRLHTKFTHAGSGCICTSLHTRYTHAWITQYTCRLHTRYTHAGSDLQCNQLQSLLEASLELVCLLKKKLLTNKFQTTLNLPPFPFYRMESKFFFLRIFTQPTLYCRAESSSPSGSDFLNQLHACQVWYSSFHLSSEHNWCG